ncbi:dTDP-4-dehydrorhamnose 3,5-epimerase [Pseudocnuella soli]|uniref:dTDP-4-dehydrorhamnose 3,5-epimerase n=1 Tax=Pseudocnuella soli TaxID=2502779 RepID=UPI00104C0B38|nr:dTDP-4-dehydrorhamnose 3,5-epimerase [Pseudocnuella soli]
MLFETCAIPGLVIVTPKLFQDSRGYFFESYNRKPFVDNGITADFVQDNQSRSTYGVIRGLHYQRNPFAQAKLVRVLQGTILDVAVDIREGSPTFGQHFSIELSDENCKQLYLPAGFAHGFSVLSETAVVSYKCDQYYNKESEGGIRFDDPALGIDWRVPTANAIVSDKDLLLPVLSEAHHNFTF